MATASFPDRVPADHWWCAGCGQWGRVDDVDLCRLCADEQGLAGLVDLVLDTDQLAYRLEEAHWRARGLLSIGTAVASGDAGYHAEAQLALGSWLRWREEQRYTVSDLHAAGGGWGRRF